MDDYIIKPFSDGELIVRIKNLLNNYNERNIALTERYIEEPPGKTDIQKSDWLISLEKILETELSDPSFRIDMIPSKMAMSRSKFYRVMKEQTGLSPNLYLREIKLQRARVLLLSNEKRSIKEITHPIGFLKPSYFAELFKSRFGKSPSDYVEYFGAEKM